MARKKKSKGRRKPEPDSKRVDKEESENKAEQVDKSNESGSSVDVEAQHVDESDPSRESESPKSESPKKKQTSKHNKGGNADGVLALFDHPDTILHAAEKARDNGFEKWDVYTPFPIHGMDDAMGLGRSPVPWITFTMGVVGFASALILQFGTMVYSWPNNYGGKPFAAWPSFVPITFEMTVLLAGVSTAIGSLFLGGIFKLRKRIAHPDVTSHRFAIFVEATDPKFDEEETLSLFEGTGAIEVRAVKEGE